MNCEHNYLEHMRSGSSTPDAMVCSKCGHYITPDHPEWPEEHLPGGLTAFERKVLRQFTGDHQGMGWGAAYGSAREFLIGHGYATKDGQLTDKGRHALGIITHPKRPPVVEYDEAPEEDGLDWPFIGGMTAAWAAGPIMLVLGYSWPVSTAVMASSIAAVCLFKLYRRQ